MGALMDFIEGHPDKPRLYRWLARRIDVVDGQIKKGGGKQMVERRERSDLVLLKRAFGDVNEVQNRLRIKNPALVVVLHGLKEAIIHSDDL